MRNKHEPKKVVAPAFVGKEMTCILCGGTFVVRKCTSVFVVNADGKEHVAVVCPHCHRENLLHTDPNKVYREKLTKFILSRVEPIKEIEDEAVRLPLQELLDAFNEHVQED